MLRSLFALIILVTGFLLRPDSVLAEGEFLADYSVFYDISTAGVALVNQTVTLTNQKSDIYPKQYSIIIDTDQVRNVTASDTEGNIIPDVLQKDGKTQILLSFNKQVVGLGKKMQFSLRYEHLNVAEKNGTIWEVTVPGISDSKDLGDYQVAIRVPDTFGPVAYRTPEPAGGSYWTKAQMLKGGISIAYGTSQFFTLDLRYFLDNESGYRKTVEIALPPDTAYQKVSIADINPKPEKLTRDNDGNWLAVYSLAPESDLEVKAQVRVSITLLPRADFSPVGIDENLFTQATAHWPTQFEEIRRLGEELKTPQAIYDFTVSTLSYDYDRVNNSPVRKGAIKAISDPASSICTEFTDVFVAVSRAAGIPARQVIGYAYTNNSRLRPLSLVTDVLHAWPEYYDREKKLWIPVDPTWGNTTGGMDYFTKLDFNHIVFAINGTKDDYPYPAGSYREPGKEGRILDIRFADTESAMHLDAQYAVSVTFPKMIASGLMSKGTAMIENTSGVAANNVLVTITIDPGSKSYSSVIDQIPPYSTASVPFSYVSESFMTNATGRVHVAVDGNKVSLNFTIRPIHVIIAVTIFSGILVIILLWAGIRRLPFPGRVT